MPSSSQPSPLKAKLVCLSHMAGASHQCLWPLCLTRATIKLVRLPLEAQREQHGCLGHSKVGHWTFNNCHEFPGCHQIFNMFKTVTEGLQRRLVTQRSLKWGGKDTESLPHLQNGCTTVGQWSPCNKCIQLQSSVPQLGWRFCLPRASSVPSLCLQWCKLNDDCDDHCASIWRVWQPLSNHGDGSAFFLPLLYYLLCLPSCLEIDGSFKRGIKVAGAVTQKQDPMGLGDHEASWSYFWSLKGGTKVITLCKEDLSCQEQINSLHESWRSVPSYSSQSSHTSTSSH